MLAYFLQGFGLGVSAAVQPGPFQAYLLGRSLQLGWKRALPAALAPLISDGPIILLVVLVLSQVPRWLLRGLAVAGGLFVLYLAYQTFQSFRNFKPVTPASGAERQNLLQAALMNALSPNPYIFWSLVGGPILLRGWQVSPLHGVSFLLGMYLMLVAGNAGLILLFSSARGIGPGFSRGMLAFSAAALLLFGIYQFFNLP